MSVILWSIGNEVTEGFKLGGDKVASKMVDFVHGLAMAVLNRDRTGAVTLDASSEGLTSGLIGISVK